MIENTDSMDRIKEIKIFGLIKPLRIDKYLAERFTYLNRSSWQRQIELGKIFVNNVRITSPAKKICDGDRILYRGKTRSEPAINTNYQILYEDQYIVAVNKSGDMPVHPAGVYFHNTLTALLEKRFKSRFYLIHRLDRETSGIIIAARSAVYAASFQKYFKNAQKIYNAIVYGKFPEKLIIDIPLGEASRSIVRKKREAFPEAKEKACTHFFRLDYFNNFSLIEALPQTGRLHQIRAHLNYGKFPIVGDKLYGKDENYFLEFIRCGMTPGLLKKLLLCRSALHALELKFFHPYLGKDIDIKTELPEDLQKFIKECKSGHTLYT